MEMGRKEMRELAGECVRALSQHTPLSDEALKRLHRALTTPLWFSAHELRMAADAMDLLGWRSADALTLRRRLDDFEHEGPIIKNGGGFAAYLKYLPNGGME